MQILNIGVNDGETTAQTLTDIWSHICSDILCGANSSDSRQYEFFVEILGWKTGFATVCDSGGIDGSDIPLCLFKRHCCVFQRLVSE